MKKTVFFLLLSFICMAAAVYFYKHSMTFRRAKFESFLKYESRQLPAGKITKDEDGAADQPEMAAVQDYFMTVDPATGTVPRERLLTALRETKAFMDQKSTRDDISWYSCPAEMGGRTRAIMYDPNDPTHHKVWAGGVTGGLWYNTNITSATNSWVPVGDFWPTLAIRCITYDPNNKMTFYIGTGEAETAIITYRESSGLGDGIWKSADGGQTWTLLNSTTGFAYIPKIVVRNEGGNSVIYAAVVSGLYHGVHQSLPSNGLFRSADGGSTWTQVLPNIPGFSVPYSPSDVELGADGRIYVGTMPDIDGDGAAVLLFSDTGLPGSWTVNETYRNEILADPQFNIPGRVVLGCAPSNANIVYALVASGLISSANNFKYFYCYHILRSADRGATWTEKTLPPDANGNANFATIAWHALDIAVDPNHADTVFIGGLDVQKTSNGGDNWTRVSDWSLMYYGGGDQYVHADQHIMVYKPGSSSELLLGCDGGVFYSGSAQNPMPVFSQRNQDYNTLQFYSADLKNVPGSDDFLGGLQDNGSLYFYQEPFTINNMVSGGDGAFCFFDRNDPSYSISSIYYNTYYLQQNGMDINYLTDWSSGIFVNPADYDYRDKTIFANACDFVGNDLDYYLMITNVISSPSGQYKKAGTTTDVYFSAVRWSPYSPAGHSTLFLGTESGRLFKVEHAESIPLTTEITGSNFPAGNISCISLGSSEDTLLVTFSNYGIASVFESYNGGQAWDNKEGNLPDMPVRWGLIHSRNSRQVMLATETGIWITDNVNAAPVTWTPAITGMANVRVDQLNIRTSDLTVIAATHGRGLFTAIWDVVNGISKQTLPGFSIFPNPVGQNLTLSFESSQSKEIAVSIINTEGKTVVSKTITTDSGKACTLDVTELAAGTYFVTIYGDGVNLGSRKIVKY